MKTKIFEEIANKKRYVQGFNSCFNYIFHGPMSAFVDCYDILGYGYTDKLFIFDKDYLEYQYYEKDLIDIGNEFLKRYFKDKSYLKNLFKIQEGYFKKAHKFMKKLDNMDYEKLSKKELIELYQKIWYYHHKPMCVGHLVEPIPYVVEPMLKSKIEKAIGLERHDKKFREIFNLLMQPSRPSFVNEEQLDILQIIKTIEKDKTPYRLFKNSEPKEILDKLNKGLLNKITKHRKKYFFNQLNYYHGEGLEDIDYIGEIKLLIEEGIGVDKKIKEELEQYAKNDKIRKKIIEKYNFSNEIVNLINLSIEGLHWQDDRKKYMLSCVFYMNLLLKEIGKRYKIPHEMLKRYIPQEITNEKLSNFDFKDAKERMKHYVAHMYRKNNKIKVDVYVGDDYKKFMEIYKKQLTSKDNLHGTCASLGKSSGIVRICKTKEDISKFKQGDVLIASMTRPEFVPAMKKAAAIVTDEGGITCHAAIVSRELGIPCVIGTKVATKVLKNGMKVEVNANHGVVKKL